MVEVEELDSVGTVFSYIISCEKRESKVISSPSFDRYDSISLSESMLAKYVYVPQEGESCRASSSILWCSDCRLRWISRIVM